MGHWRRSFFCPYLRNLFYVILTFLNLAEKTAKEMFLEILVCTKPRVVEIFIRMPASEYIEPIGVAVQIKGLYRLWVPNLCIK